MPVYSIFHDPDGTVPGGPRRRRRAAAAGVFVTPPPLTAMPRRAAADVVPACVGGVAFVFMGSYFPTFSCQFIPVSANAAFRDSHSSQPVLKFRR